MTPQQAKKIVSEWLVKHSMTFKLTARTVDFTDLARCKVIFVQVQGWEPNPLWNDLKALAKTNGFYVES
jgi:hypothetical protein